MARQRKTSARAAGRSFKGAEGQANQPRQQDGGSERVVAASAKACAQKAVDR